MGLTANVYCYAPNWNFSELILAVRGRHLALCFCQVGEAPLDLQAPCTNCRKARRKQSAKAECSTWLYVSCSTMSQKRPRWGLEFGELQELD